MFHMGQLPSWMLNKLETCIIPVLLLLSNMLSSLNALIVFTYMLYCYSYLNINT